MDGGGREERAALNEVAFRAANETLRRRIPDPDDRGLDPYPFLCECSDQRCTRVIEVPLAVYAEMRAHPARFVLVPGHADDSEPVVDATERYEVVEKHGVGGEVARAHWETPRIS